MRLLLDATISWRLVKSLRQHFTDCFHVDSISLSVPAKDTEVWEYAKLNELIIVTNDDDFFGYVQVKGFPPKIILLRTGNQSNEYIEMLLIKHKEDIAALYTSGEYGILEIF